MVSPSRLEAAADRGTRVHEICANIALGLFIPAIPADCEGYVESYRRWHQHIIDEVIIVETRLVDTAWGYHGQIDQFVKSKHGENILVDLKTPTALQRSWRLQMAGYANLVEENGHRVDRVGSLRLDREGKTARMEYYDNSAQDFKMFVEALNLYRYFKS